MRIIAGEFRSRTLVAPAGTGTRPTTDRARESLFNVLSHFISFEGISVLDLFAGSGALALEALSRGATKATLVDKSRKAVRAIEQNASTIGVDRQVTILQRDVRNFLEARPGNVTFDLIVADPPYDEVDGNLLARALSRTAGSLSRDFVL